MFTKFQVKNDHKSYSKVATTLVYRQLKSLLYQIFGVLCVLIGFYFIKVISLPLSDTFYYFIYGLLFILLPLITSKIVAKRSFFSNNMLQEEIAIESVNDKIMTTVLSFNSELSWSSLHQVIEFTDCFVLCQSKRTIMMIIAKSGIGEKRSAFKDLIKSQRGLNFKLLK